MRILIGADTYGPDVNGASYFAQRLAAGLVGRGHEVHVACPARGPRASSAVPDPSGPVEHRLRSVPVPRPAGFRVCPAPGLVRHAGALLDRVQPAVVHVQCHFLLGRALTVAAADRAIPVVATTHMRPENIAPYVPAAGQAARWFHAAFWRRAARVLGEADVVTAPTPLAASLAESRGVPGPVVAISNGLDLARFGPGRAGAGVRHRLGLADRPTVGYVGRLDREKHVDEIVEALVLLRRRVDARLLLVGEGTERRRLAALVRDRGVGDAVVLAGFVADDELPEAYAAMDVFVNAGRAELQSLVTLEAMAGGRPVVAADAGALPHLVHDGENGYRYPPGDAAALSRALAAVLTDPGRAAAMSRRSLEIARSHSLDATLSAFESIYRGWRPGDPGATAAVRPGAVGAVGPRP